jgi:hypothetical protein
LRDLDSNSDDQITKNDSLYSQLRIWRDANHDGQSESEELASLSSVGVKAISTHAREAKSLTVTGTLISLKILQSWNGMVAMILGVCLMSSLP